HGIEVASLIAGDTNNGVGMASIGYNTKMVGYVGDGYSAVYDLSQISGIRIINMSWAYPDYYYSQYEDSLYTELRDDYNIVLVAAAGNQGNGQFGYMYPASYDAVISVTSVGSKNYRGQWQNGGTYNWKDCAQYLLLASTYTNTVNDKVNVSAPGYDLFRATNTNGQSGSTNTYSDEGSGTSLATPLVSG